MYSLRLTDVTEKHFPRYFDKKIPEEQQGKQTADSGTEDSAESPDFPQDLVFLPGLKAKVTRVGQFFLVLTRPTTLPHRHCPCLGPRGLQPTFPGMRGHCRATQTTTFSVGKKNITFAAAKLLFLRSIHGGFVELGIGPRPRAC
jgi:hypothetical protein